MKFTRSATANWKGTGLKGKGTISTESNVLKNKKYGFKTRFEGEPGTNPEELIGAAHAGCFTMQLSFLLNEEGFTADDLTTSAAVSFKDGDIVKIALDLKGKVPNISLTKFKKIATKAKQICPISKLLNTRITLKAELEQ